MVRGQEQMDMSALDKSLDEVIQEQSMYSCCVDIYNFMMMKNIKSVKQTNRT